LSFEIKDKESIKIYLSFNFYCKRENGKEKPLTY
jgi:hypothetical protein